jgi:hypothetical protein
LIGIHERAKGMKSRDDIMNIVLARVTSSEVETLCTKGTFNVMKAYDRPRFYHQIIYILALSIGPQGMAAASDLSKERCDVLMGPVCMVLPSNMSLTYDAPVDFGRYRLIKDDKVILQAYVQNSPAPVKGTQSFDKDVGDFTIKGFKFAKGGSVRIDLVFVPRVRRYGAVHVYADFSDAQREDVVEVLAGLRTCHQKSFEELTCPLVSKLGRDLVEWLSK